MQIAVIQLGPQRDRVLIELSVCTMQTQVLLKKVLQIWEKGTPEKMRAQKLITIMLVVLLIKIHQKRTHNQHLLLHPGICQRCRSLMADQRQHQNDR